MNIEWLIPCRYAEVHDNLATIIGAPVDRMWVPQVPSPVGCMLVMRFTGTAEEFESGEEHQLRSCIRAPGGDVVAELTGGMVVGGDQLQEEWLNGVTLPVALQFMAETEGTYTVEQFIDNLSASIPLHVAVGAPPGAA